MSKRRAIIVSAIVVVVAGALVLWLGVYRPGPIAAAHDAKSAATSPAATSAASPSPTASPTPPADAAYQAVLPQGPPSFAATFGESQLDPSLWGTCYPGANPAVGCTNFGNSMEAEWYLPSEDQISGGMLRLIAQREPTAGLAKDGSPETYGCRSGMVTTYPGFHFQYGFLQVEAKIPHAAGLWSALWLAAANLQWPPEMDMIESWGVDAESAAFFHASSGGYVKGLVPVSLTSDWQTFSLYWTSSEMEFFVGTTKIMTITSNVPQQAMYFIANVAEYQPAAPGNCTGELDLRSLKYWNL
jgi:beta-glucanase (GH16 family)